MSYFKLFAIALLSASLAGCPANTLPDPDPTDTTYGDNDGVDTSGINNDGYGPGQEFDDTMDSLGTVIYFEFNSSDVRAQDQDLVAAHAIALNKSPYVSVRLEGHADERGSREYNIGLGERRAQAVRQMLMIQGVGASQIQTVSFGEERPDAMGSSESDYAQNRRVEIKTSN
jgi:peptidoglycan-associated lipoprotein